MPIRKTGVVASPPEWMIFSPIRQCRFGCYSGSTGIVRKDWMFGPNDGMASACRSNRGFLPVDIAKVGRNWTKFGMGMAGMYSEQAIFHSGSHRPLWPNSRLKGGRVLNEGGRL